MGLALFHRYFQTYYPVTLKLRILVRVPRRKVLEDIHALYQLSEDAMSAIKAMLRCIGYEELGAVGIGAALAIDNAPATWVWLVNSSSKE